MKKSLLFLLCILVFESFGQEKSINVGVEGAVNFGSLYIINTSSPYTRIKVGYSTGLFAQYNFQNRISIKTGFYFEQKGTDFEFPLTDEFGNYQADRQAKESFDYFTVPILFRKNYGEKFNFFWNAGPSIGFLIKSSYHIEAKLNFPEYYQDRTEFMNRVEYGLSTGLGLAYSLNEKIILSFEARNNLGLRPTSNLLFYGNGEVRTNTLNLFLGISYKLKK